MTDAKNILIIDDDREIAGTLQAVLQNAGYRTQWCQNGVEGQKVLEAAPPDLVITDMMMPRMGGFPILEHIKGMTNPPAVIMITANEGGRHKAYAEMLGVSDYLRKPFPMEALLDAVSRAIQAKAGEPKAKLKRASKKKVADDEETA